MAVLQPLGADLGKLTCGLRCDWFGTVFETRRTQYNMIFHEDRQQVADWRKPAYGGSLSGNSGLVRRPANPCRLQPASGDVLGPWDLDHTGARPRRPGAFLVSDYAVLPFPPVYFSEASSSDL